MAIRKRKQHLFSLHPDTIKSLKVASKQTGIPMSKLLDMAIHITAPWFLENLSYVQAASRVKCYLEADGLTKTPVGSVPLQ